jgi:hypothetical protein
MKILRYGFYCAQDNKTPINVSNNGDVPVSKLISVLKDFS